MAAHHGHGHHKKHGGVTHVHHHASGSAVHIHSHHKKRGGKVGHHDRGGGVGEEPMLVSGNPDVVKEAEHKGEGGSRKHGGHAKHKRADGGKVIGRMHGGGVMARLDRPGRKRGGGVGANLTPLSTAHKGSSGSGGDTPRSADTYGGDPDD